MSSPKNIKMREFSEVQAPIKMMRNPQTKLLRQATPEEIKAVGTNKEAKAKAKAKQEQAQAQAAEAQAQADKQASADKQAQAAEDKAQASADKVEDKAQTSVEVEAAADPVAALAAAEKALADEPDPAKQAELQQKVDEAKAAVTASQQNFYWIKHAETIANLYNNEETDKYKNSDALNEAKVNARVDYVKVGEMSGGESPPAIPTKPEELKVSTRSDAASFSVEMKDWFEKKTQEIDEKTDKNPSLKTNLTNLAKICDVDDLKYDPVKCRAAIAASNEDTRLYGYIKWLQTIPFYFSTQPTLTDCGMVEARILGVKMKEKEIKPDAIVCAATVPAMMTAYLTALYAELPGSTIYVVPYLNDKENEAAIMFKGTNFHDYANYGINPADISEVGKAIDLWFRTAEIFKPDGTAAEPLSSADKPLFDYTCYQGGEELRDSGATPDVFFKWFNTSALKDKTTIWAFSYDTPIKAVRKQVLAGLIDDSKYPNLWDVNTAVFQHKKQGNDLQAIFPADAPPKLTTPFPSELAECGLIYYPNAGVEKTKIRITDTLLAMDNFKDTNNLLELYRSIINITHKEDRFAELESLYKTFIIDNTGSIIPPPDAVDKDKWRADLKASYTSDVNYIEMKYNYLKESKDKIDKGSESFNRILEEEIKEFQALLNDLIQKYKGPSGVNDTIDQITKKIDEELKKNLDELGKLTLGYLTKSRQLREAALDKDDAKQKTLNSELRKLETDVDAIKIKGQAIEKKNTKFKAAKTTMNAEQLKANFLTGGGGGSRKKHRKKSKKSIRKNRNKNNKKSKKHQKKGRKYTKRK